MRWTGWWLVAGLWACDDGTDATSRSQTDAGAADTSAPDAADAAATPSTPTPGTWRMRLVFPDLSVSIGARLEVTASADTFGFDLRLVSPAGEVTEPLATVAEVAIDAEGAFAVDLARLPIPAAFSPSGTDLEVDLQLAGEVRSAEFFCGVAAGRVESLSLDLGAGTFGAALGDAEPAAGCDAVPPPPVPTLGGERPARVLLPADYDADPRPRPLVLLLHGFGASGAAQDAYLGISGRRDAEGFIAVVPDGTEDERGDRFWNATPACCDTFDTGVDDVAYLSGIIDETIDGYRVDPGRVYLVGHSNGAFMSYRLACELGDRIAAVVGLAGSTVVDEATCLSTAPISVLHIHALDDATVPYGGDPDPVEGYPSAEETARRWAARAGCDEAPSVGAPLDLVSAVAGAETEVRTWSGCEAEAQVALWSLAAGGHVPAFQDRFTEVVLPWLLAQRRP